MQVYRPTWLEINLSHIAHNFRAAKAYAEEDVIAAAVVKANAYGHGAVEVSRACVEAGAGYLVVATMGEALELREAGFQVPILILGWTPEENFEQAIEYEICVALYDAGEAEKLNAKALAMGKNALGHLKIDTGMSRLGMQADESGLQTAEAILKMEGITIKGMFTHFSKADEADKTFANLQIERFNRFTEDMDKMEFHKIVRGVSRRCDICYEFSEDRVEYDDIEDPLPFDINADVIEIDDRDFAIWYRDMMEGLQKYQGKTVKFKGLIARDRKIPDDELAIGRHIMTCCVEDIQYGGVVCKLKNATDYKTHDWAIIKGKINLEKNKLYRSIGPVITIEEIERCEPLEDSVATFY